MKKFGLICITLFSGLLCRSQSLDDTLELSEIVVKLPRVEYSSKTVVFDSTILNDYQSGNMADLLNEHSPVFIKSYGLGSLATAASRGGGGSHTQVLWEGIPLNSSMNGISDLALVPVSFFDHAEFNLGFNKFHEAGGGLGGYLSFGNYYPWDDTLSVQLIQSIGSFNNYQTGLNLNYGKKKFRNTTKVFYQNAQNDFLYDNISLAEVELDTQQNAALEYYGILDEAYYEIKKFQIYTKIWWQHALREIPPLMTNAVSGSLQEDRNFRGVMGVQRLYQNKGYSLKLAYLDDLNGYEDSVSSIFAEHFTKTFWLKTRYFHNWNEIFFMEGGLQYRYQQATSQNLDNKIVQDFAAGFFNIKLNIKDKVVLQNRSRVELLENFGAVYLYHQSIDVDLGKYWKVYGNIGQNWRFPTINDIFWDPGGNPDLVPERSVGGEVGIKYSNQDKYKKIKRTLESTFYYQEIDNWIIWQPGQNGVWSPENILLVASMGNETRMNFEWNTGNVNWIFNGGYAFNKTVELPHDSADIFNENNQLPYVPRHKFTASIRMKHKLFYARYTQVYNGFRYIASDNSWYLPSHTLGNFIVGKNLKFNRWNLGLNFRVNNIWDMPYQVIAWRPMPGRNYAIEIKIAFK